MTDAVRAALRDLPDKPGCYLFRDRGGHIIYVGKAVALRRRVQSYFRASTLARAAPKLRSLIHSVTALETIVVRNEAEALLTEGRLIKEYKPRYNVVFRDDKRYLALRAEARLEMPRFTACRIVRDGGDEYFGPFPSAQIVHTAKDFVEKRYGIRKCRPRQPDAETYRHCLNDIVAHCAAPCVGRIAPDAYRERFAEACACLRGERPQVLKALQEAMAAAAAAQSFEKAAELRDTLFALRDLVRLRARPRPAPGLARDTAAEGLRELAKELDLPAPPRVIEGFDISHIGGTLTVASLVVCVDGRPVRARYRHYRIRTVEGADDPRGIAEVILRRYRRLLEERQAPPDLVLVDGGITQLCAARAALASLGLAHLPAVGLAKRLEEVVVDRGGQFSLLLPPDSPARQVLMRLRDEAHRFAIAYNRELRARRIRASVLDEIPGVGPRRKVQLLRHFGSVRRLAAAAPEEIAAAGGGGLALARTILDALRDNRLADGPRAHIHSGD